MRNAWDEKCRSCMKRRCSTCLYQSSPAKVSVVVSLASPTIPKIPASHKPHGKPPKGAKTRPDRAGQSRGRQTRAGSPAQHFDVPSSPLYGITDLLPGPSSHHLILRERSSRRSHHPIPWSPFLGKLHQCVLERRETTRMNGWGGPPTQILAI